MDNILLSHQYWASFIRNKIRSGCSRMPPSHQYFANEGECLFVSQTLLLNCTKCPWQPTCTNLPVSIIEREQLDVASQMKSNKDYRTVITKGRSISLFFKDCTFRSYGCDALTYASYKPILFTYIQQVSPGNRNVATGLIIEFLMRSEPVWLSQFLSYYFSPQTLPKTKSGVKLISP